MECLGHRNPLCQLPKLATCNSVLSIRRISKPQLQVFNQNALLFIQGWLSNIIEGEP